MAQYCREIRYGQDFVLIRLELSPPLLLWSYHAPQHQLSNETFEDSVSELQQAILDLSYGKAKRLLHIGGGDLNTQVSPIKGVIGRFAKGERQSDRERARSRLWLSWSY